MSKILEVIYYQTYLFYSKILKEESPHFTTTWGVGIGFSFIIIFSLTMLQPFINCEGIEPLFFFGLALLIYFFFYKYFTLKNRRIEIVKKKPLLFRSEIFSMAVTILFFLLAISLMAIGPIVGKYLKELYCSVD